MDIFEQASRLKLRFDTPIGPLAAEDLWDLSLTSVGNRANLDDVAVSIFKRLDTNVSFVTTTKKPSAKLDELRLEIVKHVIASKQAENSAALEKREKAAKKQKILEILAKREEAKTETASDEELRKALAELDV